VTETPTAPSAENRPFWRWLALLLALLLALAALRPLSVPDEGRYAEISRWMLVSGDWLVPRLDGLPFFHKPPLLHWLQASSMAVLGVSPWAARLVPAAAALLMVVGLYLAARRISSTAVARRAALMLAASGCFLVGGSTSTTTCWWRPSSPRASGALRSPSCTAPGPMHSLHDSDSPVARSGCSPRA